ncbi:YadA-like family protein [Pantoea sp. YR343]|uniref:YadA-like family protein n=1 Tax=Pantoea sp. YR343 TaxID=1144341 RepID=UPI000270D959|nr:YadA-like family protein [Pantoea sp. YR343]KAJ9430502.1 YadA-like family protein [Pantoea sp. YR343]
MKTKLALIVIIISVSPSYPAYSINSSLKKRISNVDKIAKENTKKINTNQKNIGNNGANIGANAKKIENNAKNIGSNGENIGANAKNIVNNAKNIASNGENIGANAKKIENNAKNIASNGENIGANAKNIVKNKTKLDAHNERIANVEKNSSQNTKSLNLLTDEFHGFETETKGRFSQMSKTISQNHKKAMAGISAAMAMNAIPLVNGKDVSVGVGSGSYGGQGSLAIGSQFQMTEIMRSSTYLSYDSNRNLGIAAGISIGW